jgi:hypothetical protein
MTADGPTLDELQKQARDLQIAGRSSMSRDELVTAIANATGVQTAGQTSAAAVAAADETAPKPGTPDEVGRPELLDVAAKRAADRKPRRVIGADDTATQED